MAYLELLVIRRKTSSVTCGVVLDFGKRCHQGTGCFPERGRLCFLRESALRLPAPRADLAYAFCTEAGHVLRPCTWWSLCCPHITCITNHSSEMQLVTGFGLCGNHMILVKTSRRTKPTPLHVMPGKKTDTRMKGLAQGSISSGGSQRMSAMLQKTWWSVPQPPRALSKGHRAH